MKILNNTLCLLVILLPTVLFAQEEQKEEVQQIQPRIMVIPWVDGEQSRIEKYESDKNYQLIMDVVSNAFEQRNFTTIDFQNEYRRSKTRLATESVEGYKSDIYTNIINNSSADILIQVDYIINTKKIYSTTQSQVTLRINAIDAYSSLRLATLDPPSATGNSSYAEVAKKSLGDGKAKLEEFLNDLNRKFADIIKRGRSIQVDIKVSEDSEHDLDYEFNGEFVRDLIFDWMEENAYQNYANLASDSAIEMRFDEVKIPLRDKRGRNYQTRNLGRDLRKAIKSWGLEASYNVTKTSITIEIK